MNSVPGHYTQRRVQTADGTTLGVYETDGVGSLVVALHGFTGSGATMLALLDAVRDGRPAIAVDLIGHGSSDAPDHADSYAMSSVVDQVLSVTGPRDRDTVHLVGYSMGGRVALSMAARAPWYFASITTISATPGIQDPIARAERHEADLALAQRVTELGIDRFVEEWLEKPIFAPYVAGLTDETRAHTVALRSANSIQGLAGSLRGTGTGAMVPVWQQLSALRSPLLAIAGELDSRYVQLASEMADAARNGRVEVVAGAGHVVHDENLAGISNAVRDFLQSCDMQEQQ